MKNRRVIDFVKHSSNFKLFAMLLRAALKATFKPNFKETLYFTLFLICWQAVLLQNHVFYSILCNQLKRTCQNPDFACDWCKNCSKLSPLGIAPGVNKPALSMSRPRCFLSTSLFGCLFACRTPLESAISGCSRKGQNTPRTSSNIELAIVVFQSWKPQIHRYRTY